ncbi:MAG: putative lipoprotein [Nevskia sp.]|nr:putative lipoprotein [Nevskia sp.]
MKSRWMLLLLVASALVSACATGNTFKDLSRRIPSLPLTQSRVYFYRTTTKDAALQPAVSLNGETVGIAKASSFFFVDREPGHYEVLVGGDVEDKLPLTLAAGQTHYVRFDSRIGLLQNYLVPIENNEIDGAAEILNMDYTGPELPKRKPHLRDMQLRDMP